MPRRPILLGPARRRASPPPGFVWRRRGPASGSGGPTRHRRRPAAAGRRDHARRRAVRPGGLRRRAGRRQLLGTICVPVPRRIPAARSKLAQHAADGLAIVGVLTDDPVEPARDVRRRVRRDVADGRSTRTRRSRRPTGSAARPQTYFIDRRGRPAVDPGRRADRRGLRAPVRQDRPVTGRGGEPGAAAPPAPHRVEGWSSATASGRSSTASR